MFRMASGVEFFLGPMYQYRLLYTAALYHLSMNPSQSRSIDNIVASNSLASGQSAWFRIEGQVFIFEAVW